MRVVRPWCAFPLMLAAIGLDLQPWMGGALLLSAVAWFVILLHHPQTFSMLVSWILGLGIDLCLGMPLGLCATIFLIGHISLNLLSSRATFDFAYPFLLLAGFFSSVLLILFVPDRHFSFTLAHLLWLPAVMWWVAKPAS